MRDHHPTNQLYRVSAEMFQLMLCFLGLISTVVLQGCIAMDCADWRQPTSNLREVVIGSCEIFQRQVRPDIFCQKKNCSAIWDAFYDAIRAQPTCNVPPERYDSYLQLTNHSVQADHSLFWENVYPFVLRFSNNGMKLTSVSSTLTGYIGNGLVWCSDNATVDGLSPPDTLCPGFETSPDCPMSVQRAFWIIASKNFGAIASGNVFIMFNASTDPIYSEQSYFAVYEQTAFQPGRVTKATVLLVNEHPDQASSVSRCEDASLGILSSSLLDNGIEYECVENRRDVIELLCLDQPGLPVCSSLPTSSGHQAISIGTVTMTIAGCVSLLLAM